MNKNPTRRASVVRKVGWVGVASMLALALLAPAAGVVNAGLTAAVYTSNDAGTIVNENIYPSKDDVYLTGGPCPQGGNLPDGDYYFEVVQPAGGGALLSTDAIKFREFHITAGFITTATGHVTHALTCSPSAAITIKLMPYNSSINGEYKLQVATASSVQACKNFDANAVFPICQQADQKSDNFKARVDAPAIAIDKIADPTEVPAAGGNVTYTYTVTNTGDVALSDVSVSDNKCSPVTFVDGDANDDQMLDLDETWTFTCTTLITTTTTNTAIAEGFDGETSVTAQDTALVTVLPPTAPPITNPPVTNPPTVPPTASPTPRQSVLAETSGPSPRVTLPPTDSLTGTAAPSTDSWRILLIVAAALLASVLVVTPARASRRRR